MNETLKDILVSALSAGIGAGGMKLYDYIQEKKKKDEELNRQVNDPFMIQR